MRRIIWQENMLEYDENNGLIRLLPCFFNGKPFKKVQTIWQIGKKNQEYLSGFEVVGLWF